jgi:hypothetical protein
VVANPYDAVSSRNVNQRFFLQVLKFLMDRNGTTALHGQVTIGTLILQVYMLILLLADEEDLSLFLIYIVFWVSICLTQSLATGVSL